MISETRPGKVRIVHDCAAKLAGVSLNNQCYQGPDLINKLVSVLLRFRQYKYAIMADVEEMYMQIKVPQKDHNALRFLWLVNGLVREYRMTSHLFGGVWCAASSTYALRRTVEDCPTEPSNIVKQAILNNFYVDDLLQSTRDITEARDIIVDTAAVLKHVGFRLTKFVVNSSELLNDIDESDRATVVKEIMPEMMRKALGVHWEICGDTFSYVCKQKSPIGPATRRTMLSFVSTMYDPLGLIFAIVLKGKLLFQEATRLKLSWDTPVPESLSYAWLEWLKSLNDLETLKFTRCMVPDAFTDGFVEIHNFCDGSQVGFGCCIYIRVINKVGKVHVCLVAAKSRLAPLKRVTVPLLELASAFQAIKMDSLIRRELDIPLIASSFWSDSEIALAYIKNETRRFKVSVANRVSVIRESSSPDQWHHNEGNLNPADIVSRGCLVSELPDDWNTGPAFLWTHKCNWPQGDQMNDLIDETDPEVCNDRAKSCNMCVGDIDRNKHPLQTRCDYYSSFYKLKKAVAWLLRVRDCLLQRDTNRGPISNPELKTAENLLIHFVQKQTNSPEIDSLRQNGHVTRSSSLSKLHPVLLDGLLVVGGRIKHAPASLRVRHPILLPHDHHLAYLIVADCHNGAHMGTEWVLSKVRMRFWMTGARNLIKRVKRNCVTCKRLYAPPMIQRMSDLPPERCLPGTAPFANVGLDLFGPIYVRLGRTKVKRYGCLFTCFNTRAVHLEKLDNLEIYSFINGFVRFEARRGNVVKIWSDNGTNLVGAQAEMARSLRGLDRQKVISAARHRDVEWVFNPPLASHHGGVWERQIRTVRKVLLGVLIKNTRLTDDILHTILCEVENIVNSRPIMKCNDDVTDDVPLTPNHLLLMNGNFSYERGKFYDGETYRRQWKNVQNMATPFWKRWLGEYLPEVQKRQKWLGLKPSLAIGDLVLIIDENAPRGSWPLGLVQEVNVGRDGLVRSARVRTKSSIFVRPISKLVSLECSY